VDQRRLLCPQVVGREAETRRFDELLSGLPLGAGATLLISGAAGVGKTRLLRELERAAAAKGIPFLIGRCTAAGARPPFGPFAEILDGVIRSGIGGLNLDRLERAYPDLARLRHDATRALVPHDRDEAERYRVHSGVARLLRTVAEQTPVVVAIDDIQWADEGTLELLPILAGRLHDQPVLIVALYRQEDAADPGLGNALAAMARQRIAESMVLGPLASGDVAQMVDATLCLRGADASALLALVESCEGNPFFVEEVLIGLAASGDLAYEQERWVLRRVPHAPAVPLSVRSAVEQRMRTLSPSAQRVLSVAAVIGQQSEFTVLQAVSGSPETELIEDLRSTIAAHLLVEIADGRGGAAYAFRHALTRDSVLAGKLERERQLLHLRVGEVLESLDADGRDRVEELAYHFDAAGDRGRAVRYHDLAARRAVDLAAFARERMHLERCVALVQEDDAARIELLLRLSYAAFHTDDRPIAARVAEDARRLAVAQGTPIQVARALLAAYTPNFQLGDDAAAEAALAGAIEVLEPLGESSELASAYATRAARALFEDRAEEGLTWGRRAIALARNTGDLRIEVMATNWVGWALASRGDPEGVAIIRGAAALAREHGLVDWAMRTYLNLIGFLRQWAAEDGEIAAVHQSAAELAERHHWRSDRFLAAETWRAFDEARWDDVVRLTAQISPAPFFAAAHLLGAFAETARRGPEYGLRHVAAIRGVLTAAGAASYVAEGVRSAETMLLAGDLSAALQHAEPAAALADRYLGATAVDAAIVSAVIAASRAGDLAARRRWLDVAADGCTTGRPGALARRAFASAERAGDEGDLDRAIEIHDEHAILFDRALSPFGWTQTQIRRAELLVRRAKSDDIDKATTVFAAVVPFWRAAGAIWYLARLREWATTQTLAFPRERRSRVGGRAVDPARLTPREREVAALISTGLTNRQIADRLVIAERTAEGHVERIREKLDLHSRAEIATWFARAVAAPTGART